MKVNDRWMPIIVFVFLLPAGLHVTAPDQARATEDLIGRYVFEYCHTGYGNSGSLQTYDGFLIDNEGTLLRYEHGDYQWSPRGSDGFFYENDLYEKYQNLKQVGTVDKSVLSAMASLIEPASRGETIQNRRLEGMDSMTYSGYLFDRGQGTYKEIVFSVRGSGATQNTSSAAKTLVSWLESVFLQDRTSTQEPAGSGKALPAAGTAGPEAVRSGKPRPVAGTVVPRPGIVQKIPAPKPELKVEMSGPFPIEEQSK